MVKLNLGKQKNSSCSTISHLTNNNLSTSLVDLGVGDPLKIQYHFLDDNRVNIVR